MEATEAMASIQKRNQTITKDIQIRVLLMVAMLKKDIVVVTDKDS